VRADSRSHHFTFEKVVEPSYLGLPCFYSIGICMFITSVCEGNPIKQP
jgi:hypothetical protein